MSKAIPFDIPSPRVGSTVLNMTPWTLYQLVNQGLIPHRRFGKRKLIPKEFFHPAYKASSLDARLTKTATRDVLVREIAKDVLKETLDRATALEPSESKVVTP
jgi:hypothetical protein